MNLSIKTVTSDAFSLLKKDPLIVAPYLIFFSAVTIFETLPLSGIKSSSLYFIAKLIIFGWVADLLFKGFTLHLGFQLYQKKEIPPVENIRTFAKKLPAMMVGTGMLIFPIFGLLKWWEINANAVQSPTPDLGILALLFLTFIPLIFLSLLLNFVPSIVITTSSNGWTAIKRSFYLLRYSFKQVLSLTSFIILIALVSISIISPVLLEVPVIGKSILWVGFQAVMTTFIDLLCLVFYCKVSEPKITAVA